MMLVQNETEILELKGIELVKIEPKMEDYKQIIIVELPPSPPLSKMFSNSP